MEDVKLAIAWPLTNEMLHSKFVVSWTLMEKPNYSFFLPEWPGPIDVIRNNLVKQVLRSDCTHLLMMDTDQVYPTDVIWKLMSRKQPIVAAKVHRRYPIFDPIMYRGELGKYTSVPDEEWKEKDLIEVDATGTGCVLFDMEVFQKIPYPWFKTQYKDNNEEVIKYGEDIGFYLKAKEAGYKVYVDSSIKIGHLSLLEITEETYFLFKKLTNHKMGS